eukprot:CAMPEP_0116026812 /NCGR_PEP_ID=MMETSP0321-20121206/14147_1 /TAXON_ID=163516 /ORGANISM="Leptocylindrus danicus var. danicus, Strain B650" /LENGTH=315 /DNA_ID=CAMNT_0003499829 /DNA_START=174 /DNA_END=1121 /DNA_ORIENTATION=-
MKRTHTPPQVPLDMKHGLSRAYSNESMTSSTDIGACLKRIRISSSSPGELALNSDLSHMADELSLCRVNHTQWCTRDQSVRIERDEVDTLRFAVGILTETGEEWSFHLQMPRMYPHQPPVIYRTMRRPSANHEQQQLGEILVSNDPNPHNDNEYSPRHSDDIFAVYEGWSPVSRLKDLILWMATLPTNTAGSHPQQGTAAMQAAMQRMVPPRHPLSAQAQGQDNVKTSKHQNHFLPNRFDLGYPRKPPTRSLSLTDIRLDDSVMDTAEDPFSQETFLASCGPLSLSRSYEADSVLFPPPSSASGQQTDESSMMET